MVDLHDELFLFEEWIIEIEDQLENFNSIRNEKILLEDIQELMVKDVIIKIKSMRVLFRNCKMKLNQRIVVYRLLLKFVNV